MKAFKAYDIRGEWGKDLNEEIAYRIGYFLPQILNSKTFLVGRDMRLSSNAMYNNLTRGLTDSGVDVDDIGLSTTPMVYWSTAHYGYDGSVMITASHNPKHHNGLKISKTNALPVPRTPPQRRRRPRGEHFQTQVRHESHPRGCGRKVP